MLRSVSMPFYYNSYCTSTDYSRRSEIRIGSLIEPKSESGSESTSESDFWENCAKSGSQSSNGDPPSSSHDEDAKAGPKPASSVKSSKRVSVSVKPKTLKTPTLPKSVHIKKSQKHKQEDYQSDNVTMRCSNAKIYPEKTGFLDLPGEVRNRIYDLVFPQGGDLEITWLTNGKDLTYFHYRAPISKKPKDFIYGKLRPGDAAFNGHFQAAIRNKNAAIMRRQQARAQTKRNRIAFEKEKKTGVVSGLPSDWTLQAKGFAALLGLNRQLHDEAASILYSRTTFSFASRAILDKFLAGLTPVARANLCKIYVAHDMESPALLKSDRVYKEKERKKWVASLQTLTSKCKGEPTLITPDLPKLTYIPSSPTRTPHLNQSPRFALPDGSHGHLGPRSRIWSLQHYLAETPHGLRHWPHHGRRFERRASRECFASTRPREDWSCHAA